MEDIYTFIVEGKEYSLPKRLITKDTYLYTCINTSVGVSDLPKKDTFILDDKSVSKEMFEVLIDYLLKGEFPEEDDLDILDFFMIPYKDTYEYIIYKENQLRKYLYNKDYISHPMTTDKYYDLIKIDEKTWDSLQLGSNLENKDLLFNNKKLQLTKKSWKEITEDNIFNILRGLYNLISKAHEYESMLPDDIVKLSKEPCVFIAGGSLFKSLFTFRESSSVDIDIFFYDCDEEKAKNIIKLVTFLLQDSDEFQLPYRPVIKRSTNAISIPIGYTPLQFITRLYKSPSEILHGFDVDCCCIGFDGKDIYMTRRCYYALTHGYNTVNFDRMSPSYEYRLAKYAVRGIPIKVPGMNRTHINYKSVDTLLYENIDKYSKNITEVRRWDKEKFTELSTEYANINKEESIDKQSFKILWDYLQFGDKIRWDGDVALLRTKYIYNITHMLRGLDKLIYMEYITMMRNYNTRSLDRIRHLAETNNDYGKKEIYGLYPLGSIMKGADEYEIYSKESKYDQSLQHKTKILRKDLLLKRDHGYPWKSFSLEEIYQCKSIYYKECHEIAVELLRKDISFNFFADIGNKERTSIQSRKHPKRGKLLTVNPHSLVSSKKITKDTTFWDLICYRLDLLFNIDENVYNYLTTFSKLHFDISMKFKVINPGEQTTGTFNKLVYDNPKLWYGTFYTLNPI